MYGKHQTQKPIKILKRMIKLSSKEGDVMLTPFAGAGSECVAAKMCNRKYIGFEVSKEYCDVAETRLTNTQEGKDSLGQMSIRDLTSASVQANEEI